MIKNKVNCPIITIFGTTIIKLITKKTAKIPKTSTNDKCSSGVVQTCIDEKQL